MKADGTKWKVEEKCRAVLGLWTERRKGVEIAREMGLSWSLLNLWQESAMEGMLDSLEPKSLRGGAAGPALGNTVRKLLERKSKQRESGSMSRLDRKLVKLQEVKSEAAT